MEQRDTPPHAVALSAKVPGRLLLDREVTDLRPLAPQTEFAGTWSGGWREDRAAPRLP